MENVDEMDKSRSEGAEYSTSCTKCLCLKWSDPDDDGKCDTKKPGSAGVCGHERSDHN
ncbi:hypothetical protein [Pontibacter akesuensis]|uniref:hypothetical protein n=1 Tax=Pontibacter akesuensis TaxID=388950 RepID=UPI0012FAF4AD|nr:hypothetical protein [Pontibacter akesuensis]GHA81189.1 hypothetical protein GCM10007389_39560 [Pontibacter akesuensis]